MLSRSDMRKREKEKKRTRWLWIRIGGLAVVFIGAFFFYIHWIETKNQLSAREPEVVNTTGPQPMSEDAQAAGEDESASKDAESGNTPDAQESDGSAAEAKDETNDPFVRMMFVGDMTFDGNVELLLKKNGFDYPYTYVRQFLETADITAGNLETPISEGGTAQMKEYAYRSSPQNLPPFKNAGFDLVTLANNHSMDYGQEALLDTLRWLKESDIQYVGAGSDIDEAFRPVIIEKNGIKTAFLGFSRVVPDVSWFAGLEQPGLAGTYAAEMPLEAITRAREQADLVVVFVHWGKEKEDYPNDEQKDLAYKYIDAGADLVVGSHPHVLQGLEQYKGKWIAYSLGNFIFTTNTTAKTWETAILEATCTISRECELELVPIITKWAQPIRMLEEDAAKLFERLTSISFGAAVDESGKVRAASSAEGALVVEDEADAQDVWAGALNDAAQPEFGDQISEEDAENRGAEE